MLIPCDEVNILNTFRVMIILLLLLLTNLHLKLLSTQGTGADKLLSTQRVNYTDPDLIIMNETKIDEQVKASEFLPKGYTGEIRKDWWWSFDCDKAGIRYSTHRIGGKHFGRNCLGDYFSQRPA